MRVWSVYWWLLFAERESEVCSFCDSCQRLCSDNELNGVGPTEANKKDHTNLLKHVLRLVLEINP